MAIGYTISFTFSPSTTISSSQVNTNFSDNSNTWNGIEAKTKTFSNLGVDTELKSGGTIKAADGTAGAPSICFTADPTIGFYRVGTAEIGVGTNNTITGLAVASSSTAAVRFSQIYYGFQAAVQSVTTTTTATTSSAFQACTNLSATITPTSASHRVLITVSAAGFSAFATNQMVVTLKRDSTDLGAASSKGFVWLNGTTNEQASVTFSYIDSPASTSALVYQVFIRSVDNTHDVEVNAQGTNSTIIAMEIV